MIALDTNVLLRYLLLDDEEQAKKASVLINGSESILITDVVLVEMIWTLKGKKYKLERGELIQVINSLFEEKNIYFENAQIIWRALNDYRKAKIVKVNGKNKIADFSDALIVNKAKFDASNKNKKFNGVYTFDIAARELLGTKEP